MQKLHTELVAITGRIEIGEIDDRRTSPERRTAVTDRRGSPRRKVLKNGRTCWLNGDSIECSVRNLSETGAQLEVRGPVPNTFGLVIDCDRYRRTCQVIWRDGGRLGVKFVELSGASKVTEGPVSRMSDFRRYAEACRTLARSSDVLSRAILLEMAVAWEAQARRPRRKAD